MAALQRPQSGRAQSNILRHFVKFVLRTCRKFCHRPAIVEKSSPASAQPGEAGVGRWIGHEDPPSIQMRVGKKGKVKKWRAILEPLAARAGRSRRCNRTLVVRSVRQPPRATASRDTPAHCYSRYTWSAPRTMPCLYQREPQRQRRRRLAPSYYP